MWSVVLLSEVEDWFLSLDSGSSDLVADAIDHLQEVGPTLGRPLVDRIKGSVHHNMKELRAGSIGTSEIRILFVFDPERQAVLLVGGDKSGQWKQWYAENVALADARYTRWLDDEHSEGTNIVKEGE